MDGLIEPQRIHIGSDLLEAAISGDVKALASLLPVHDAAEAEAKAAVHEHNSDRTVLVIPKTATHESRNEIIFEVTGGGEAEAEAAAHEHNNDSTVPVIPTTATHESRNEIIFGVTGGGDTALHFAAEHGQSGFADEVCRQEPSLIAAVNIKLETPLHCCARAGHHQIVSLIINTARGRQDDGGHYGLLDVVRAKNMHGETALHEASRFGHAQVVEKLMAVDGELATYVSDAGISPLYLAVMRSSQQIVAKLLQHSPSFAGPGGQTALHGAVSRSREITRMLLHWNHKLGRKVDEFGSTPLHYVAADGDEKMAHILLVHDASMAYVSDNEGYYPIHVAAGRNFLHVAAERKMVEVVRYVCNSKNKKFEKLLNQRDNIGGNTPLHLVVSNYKHFNSYKAAAALLKDPRVETSIINNQGRTQLDLSCELKTGMIYRRNIQYVVMQCLANCGAVLSPQRSDHVRREREDAVDVDEESKKRTTLSKNLAVASVLAVSVTFAAGLTVPTGNNSGDGTNLLLKKYPIKAFLISNACAMVCSFIVTFCVIYAGTPLVDNTLRYYYLNLSMLLLWICFACMAMAFSMATYAFVFPKVWRIGVVVCVISLAAPVLLNFTLMHQPINMRCIIAARNKGIRLNLDPHTARKFLRMSFSSLIFRISFPVLVYLVICLLALL
ncbi:Integral membrane ankyrin-repeat protein Kidins220 (protein kinase D substrate) protein [Dioscorea alata]|uniref:Integral membrane ankyrin-repeat protein Kidins220 (Protein kinase D substrate) protein n=2 Tax=Dioscorea alata TaxID=55571 RepID=A0ACB7VNP1_DIOAL|nr:Integral membrane ankyrin-repeat protein Kidins220 (protein kinase D substrate) protein [Dioscorea alata]